MKRVFYYALFLLVLAAPLATAQSFPSTHRIGATYPSLSAFVMGTGEQLSGQQFQTDGILTHKGYQYTVYYNLNRNVCIARRKMPVGAWEEVVLPYRNTVNDAHNTISMGISHKDGRIHLSYDHHNDPLRYCYSIKGSANEPDEMPWEAATFSPTTDILDKAVPNVTYPRFISMPNGNLLFECRFRWSGFGDSYLREYDADTQTWSLIGRYVQGEDVTPDACAYINGMSYDHLGRLHVTWCWRDDFGGGSNHDFYYAYSEDHGRSWKDTFDELKATTDFMDPVLDKVTRGALSQTKKSFMIEAIPYNRGYINQETQDVDSRGRIHAVNSHIPDGQASDSNWGSSRTKARLHHRFRKEDGTWVKRLITVNGVSVNSTRRVHLAIDKFDNAYVMANNVGVIMASPDDDYATWKLISEDGKSGFLSEPLADKPLLREHGVLSFVYLSNNNQIAVFDLLTKNPNTPNGIGLLAEYFSGDNFTGLISQQIVATPDQSEVPAGTKSIRWSGTFETLLGEAYTLHLNTTAKTNVFVNDRLQKVIAATSEAQQSTISYPAIAAHKNNIVIEAVTNSPLSLSWSSASTPVQAIPSSSLYPEKANDKPGTLTPPVLPGKPELEEILLSTKTSVNTTERSVITLAPFNPPAEYSLEVKTRILAATGRGMDFEARSKSGKGFRVSLSPTGIHWTNPLSNPVEIAAADNATDQTYRFAVKGDKVHIYQNQEFIGTRDAELISNILANGTEENVTGITGPDVMGEWAGPNGTGTARPDTYGWSASVAIPWNTAGGGSGVRYETVTHALEAGGTFSGRLMTIRWDGAGLTGATYFYPVTLEANTTYEFSFLYEYWANATSAQTMTVGVSSSASAANRFYAQDFVTSATAQRLRNGTMRFTSGNAGQYYITFNATWAMYGIGNLSLKSIAFDNSLHIGKNYPGGNAAYDIYYVSYQEGAFAPATDVIIAPELPVKKQLPTLLQSAITLNGVDGAKAVQSLAFEPRDDYSVEVSATVASAEGRGMDMEVRNGHGNGFRTALSPESFRWASPFAAMRQITRSEPQKQIIRYAVQGDQVHIYRNGQFAESFNTLQIGAINADGTIEEALSNVKPSNLYDGINKITNADFRNDAHNAAPTGWTSDWPMGVSPNPRIQEKSQTTELSAYPNGQKAFMFRFDANGGTYYSYGATLRTNMWHELSFDLITWGENQNAEFDVVISTVPDGLVGAVTSQRVKTPAIRATGERQVIRFNTATTAAVVEQPYYIVFRKVGTAGTMAVTDLYLKQGGLNHILFGKNYTEGTANIAIDYITVDYSGAFAAEPISTGNTSVGTSKHFVYSDQQELHIHHLERGDIIRVFDMMGRNVLTHIAASEHFSSRLTTGVYIVRINHEIKKVIVR